jgi:hypothetical protein
MAVQTRTTIKNWFRTGLKPLEAQFHDWIDSFWHKADTIAISDVDGLQDEIDTLAAASGGGAASTTLSNGGTASVLVTEILELIVIRSATTQVIKCGTTAGSGNIFNVEVASGQGYIHREDFAPENATMVLHFTSTGNFTLIQKKSTII